MVASPAPTTSATISNVHEQQLSLSLTSAGGEVFGDFRDDLARDGFAVIKRALPREQALSITNKIYKYVEDLYVCHFKRYI